MKKMKKGRPRRLFLERWLWTGVVVVGFFLFSVNLLLFRGLDDATEVTAGKAAHSPTVVADSKFEQYHSIHNIVAVGKSLANSTGAAQIKVEKTKTPISADSTNPLLQNLIDAGISLANATALASKLPSWGEVVDRFGPAPRILGLETCQAFNDKVPKRQRMLAPAGTFNTGTNLLAQLLELNCKIETGRPRKTGMEWQVNWGKHQPPRFRLDNQVHSNIHNEYMMPVVMVRDPYGWMQGMCKTRYSAHWFHVSQSHCPNLIPNHIEYEWFGKPSTFLRKFYGGDPWLIDNVNNKANFTLDSSVVPLWVRYKTQNMNHDSLVHMWKDWNKGKRMNLLRVAIMLRLRLRFITNHVQNQEYYDATFPRLMVRLEDLVYHPRTVLTQVCHCVEGIISENLTLPEKSVKQGSDNIHGKVKTGLLDAMIKHAQGNRTHGMTLDDIQFARDVLDESIMKEFGYKHP
jgi:hypothetical protein